ncbi:MAG: hypothetical protein ACRD3W_12615 [Terriglobales bacterium]
MWLIDQVGTMGPVHVYVSANALRADIPEHGVRIIAKNPDWNVIFLNDQQKLRLDMPLNIFGDRGFAWQYYPPGDLKIPVYDSKSERTKFAGLSALRFTSFDSRAGHLDSGTVFSKPPKLIKAELIYTNKIAGVPPAATKFMGGIYGMNLCKDVPLQFCLYGTDRRHRIMYTKEVKEVSEPQSFFDYPNGYKATNDQWRIMLRPGQQDEINSMGSLFENDANHSAVPAKH